MVKVDDDDMDSLMDDFESFEKMDDSGFASQMVSGDSKKKEEKKKKKKEKKEKDEQDDIAAENWLSAVSNIKFSPSVDKKRARHYDFDDLFTEGKHGKKKKKKKKKGELTDFNKEFEQETRLVKNILAQQTKFTESLQKRYDVLESSKTAARGVGKFTTDLIEAINTSRNISLAAVKELAAIKKTAIDLHMKEKKDSQSGVDDQSISNFSASLLKQAISEDRRTLTNYSGEIAPIDGTADDIFDNLENEMRDSARPDEVDKMMEYESSGAKVYALVDKDSEDWTLIAQDENGNIIPDYPLPEPDELHINRDAGMAADEYHNRYEIIWK